MSCEIHVGDIGTILRVTIIDCDTGLPIDLTGQTELKIKLSLPDLSVIEKVAVFTNTGTDGKIQYVTVADDLSDDGRWRIQGFVVIPDGSWSSSIGNFEVLKNL